MGSTCVTSEIINTHSIVLCMLTSEHHTTHQLSECGWFYSLEQLIIAVAVIWGRERFSAQLSTVLLYVLTLPYLFHPCHVLSDTGTCGRAQTGHLS